MNSEQYITTMGWMYSLGIDNLTELQAYAIIYGFSQDKQSFFTGSISYMQEFLMCSRHTAIEVMKRLEQKGLVVKEQYEISRVKLNRYQAVVPASVQTNAQPSGSAVAAPVVQPPQYGSAVSAPGVVQSLHYNNTNNKSIDSIKEKNKKKDFDLSFVGDAYKEAFSEWLQYKQSIGKPYHTQQSVELCYRHALTFAADDPQQFRQVIEQSIANGWAGLFQLKHNTAYGNTTHSAVAPAEPTDPTPRQRNYHFSF